MRKRARQKGEAEGRGRDEEGTRKGRIPNEWVERSRVGWGDWVKGID